jgi:hypothetical protein
MTRGASGTKAGVLASDVTCGACNSRVFAGKRELGRVVVERRTLPLRSRMAGFARLRESRVTRILGRLIVGQMARGAGCAKAGELTADVTGGTGYGRVLSS